MFYAEMPYHVEMSARSLQTERFYNLVVNRSFHLLSKKLIQVQVSAGGEGPERVEEIHPFHHPIPHTCLH